MFLVIDNYDSFVFNLIDYVHQLGEKTFVSYNDTITISEIINLNPCGIFLSPGPKHPKDSGICPDIIKQLGHRYPILGICLGHQAIGYAYGANIDKTQPAHGFASEIIHNQQDIFKNLPHKITVGRYHSLSIIDNDNFPECLDVTAQIPEPKMIMAVKHKEHPVFGVQFHPESILTPEGLRIIQNFIQINDLTHKSHSTNNQFQTEN